MRAPRCAGCATRARWRPRCASASPPTKRRVSSPRAPTCSSTGPRACAPCSPRWPPETALRFVDFLRSTVMLSAGAATTLGVITVLAASQSSDDVLVIVCAGWWLAAAMIGTLLGRRASATPPIARVLADGKNATMLPEHRLGSVLVNRLWPLLVCLVVAGGLAVLVPQVTGIATRFAIIWALAWRKQDSAVQAI